MITRLKLQRTLLEIRQGDIPDVPQNSYCYYETRQRPCGRKHQELIARAFHMDAVDLFGSDNLARWMSE